MFDASLPDRDSNEPQSVKTASICRWFNDRRQRTRKRERARARTCQRGCTIARARARGCACARGARACARARVCGCARACASARGLFSPKTNLWQCPPRPFTPSTDTFCPNLGWSGHVWRNPLDHGSSTCAAKGNRPGMCAQSLYIPDGHILPNNAMVFPCVAHLLKHRPPPCRQEYNCPAMSAHTL